MLRPEMLDMCEGIRFGAIDAGSNSVRCLAVDLRSGVLGYVGSGAWITRLTDGIGSSEYDIRPEALERTVEAVRKAGSLLEKAGVDPIATVLFATESLRCARNGLEAQTALERASGIPLRLLEGSEEAVLSRRGALLGLDGADCVFDLGGGSLEISCESGSVSVPAGAVRMRSRFGEDAAAVRDGVLLLLSQGFPAPGKGLAGVGGTSSSVVMMLKGIPVSEYHPAKLHGHVVSSGDIDSLIGMISAAPPGEIDPLTGLEPARADIIVPGMIVIRTLLEAMHLKEYTHSETDLLWAVCADTAEASGKRVVSARVE